MADGIESGSVVKTSHVSYADIQKSSASPKDETANRQGEGTGSTDAGVTPGHSLENPANTLEDVDVIADSALRPATPEERLDRIVAAMNSRIDKLEGKADRTEAENAQLQDLYARVTQIKKAGSAAFLLTTLYRYQKDFAPSPGTAQAIDEVAEHYLHLKKADEPQSAPATVTAPAQPATTPGSARHHTHAYSKHVSAAAHAPGAKPAVSRVDSLFTSRK
jgi:hypothetical protein